MGLDVVEEYNFEKAEKSLEKLNLKKLKVIDSYYDNEISRDEFIKLKEQYQKEADKLESEIKAEREKTVAIENEDSFIDEICKTVKQLVSFEVFNDSIAKEILDKIVIHSKSNIEVYLKGFSSERIFFADGSKILDNNFLCR